MIADLLLLSACSMHAKPTCMIRAVRDIKIPSQHTSAIECLQQTLAVVDFFSQGVDKPQFNLTFPIAIAE